jgi:hypothetical protein
MISRPTLSPCLLLISLLLVNPVDAYELRTHRELSDVSFQMSRVSDTLRDVYGIEPNALLRQRIIALPNERLRPQDWVAIGGSYEDVPFWRVLNHFYDPVRNEGLGWLGAAAAPDWALEPAGPLDGQNHSYRDARDAFYQGLTDANPERRERELGFTFFALGHVIHLIQDVAQPQHVRRDVHPPFTPRASFVEQYVDENIANFVLTGAQIPQANRLQDLWTGMAGFTNANFVSAGTNFTALQNVATAERYPRPVLLLGLQGVIEAPTACADGVEPPASLPVFGNWILDPITGAIQLNPWMTTHSIFDQHLIERGEPPIFALNCFNIDAQADRLLRRAVAYSAALLRYFFRGQLAVNLSNAGIQITNGTPGETMAGTFELYYDTDDGTRQRLTSWTLELGPRQSSQQLTTPRLAQAYASAQCLLVFRGRLGQEDDAVAGVRGPCPVEFNNDDPPEDPEDPPGDPFPPDFQSYWCFTRDAWGSIFGPSLTTVPFGQDPATYLLLYYLPPGAVVLRCDPFVPDAPWPTL